MVQGRVAVLADERMKVQFRLWDVFAQQQMVGQVYTTVTSNWRRIAHIVSDAIYKRVTGEEGYFDTRIVYIALRRDHKSGGSSGLPLWTKMAKTTTFLPMAVPLF